MSEALKIVVPTDFSDNSLAVIEQVQNLGRLQSLEVHCVTAVQQPMMAMPAMSGAAVTMPTIGELEAAAGESLERFAASNLGGLGATLKTKVLVGRPAEEIADYAKSIDADMIVIATRGQSGLAHMLLGSTTEGVVRQAECAVLTVRS